MHKNKSCMRLIDKPGLHGCLRFTVYKGGVPIEKFEDNNLITSGARLQMAHLIAGDALDRSINRIAVGTNGNVPTVSDTEITNSFIKPVEGFEYPENGQVQINWKLEVGEANGKEIREFGLLTTDGTLFARRIRNTPIHKESDISIEGEWIIIF